MKVFYVNPVWDDEAQVFYSESDIIGLHVEAPTLEEFEEAIKDVAVDLIISNHLSKREIASTSISDLIPMVKMFEPLKKLATA